jgi:lysophospholipase L1-like esterase
MPSPCRILLFPVFLWAGAACSVTATDSTADSAAGGAEPASGGSAPLAGGASNPAGGAIGVPAAGAPAQGAGASSGGASPIGNGGSSSTAGAGQSMAGSSAGGSPSVGGAAIAGAAGSGGQVDQSSLPSITVHLAGDSTMANYPANTTQEGWGQEFGQNFIAKVTVDNQALGGANIQSFYSSRWKTLINNTKAGDYVFAAFGINDSGTTHGPVTPADFQSQMNTMADEVAAKKATFIPTTSSPLQVWSGGKETNARLQPYCDATIAVGKGKMLLVDDLNARGVEYYNMIGQTPAAALTFNGDKAHFNKAGATQMALLAAQDLKRINSPLAAYLK